MPHALPPDFDTFMLPPPALASVPRLPPMGSLDIGPSGHAWARQELDSPASNHTAQVAGQPGEPNRAGIWSPTDHLLAHMEDLDLGISGHAWARQQVEPSTSGHTAQPAAQAYPAPQPYYLTRLHLLQQVLQQQGEPSPTHTAHDATVAGQDTEIAQVPAVEDVDAPDTPEMPAAPVMAALLDALDASRASDAPMAPEDPIAPEEVLLEYAAEPAFTPVAGWMGAMAVVGLIGLHPEGSFSGL